MERDIQKNGLVNLLILLVAGVGAFAVARYCNSLAGLVSVVFMGLGTLVAAVSWFQMRLEQSERLEKMELEELARGHGQSALFEAKEAELFPAQRAREQFERYFVPIFTVILCLVEAGGAYFFWRWLSRSTTQVALKEPMAGLFLFFLFALVLFLLGRFSATFARLENQRLLRPGASYLLLNAFLSAVVAGGIIGVQARFPRADLYVAYAFCALLALVAVETLVGLVLEMYRPRVRGKVERPIYDSRLVGLLGQPEGLITTAAQAIDYQFGFKVSETWFYRFFERALLWLVPLQVLLVILSTSLVIIEPGEQAVLERFGSPVPGRTLLEPGPHLVWPWPVSKLYRLRTGEIQSFDVGFSPEPEKKEGPAVLWAVEHHKEDFFLIANREAGSLQSTNDSEKHTPPVSLLAVSIPVQYQITNLLAWHYNNEDAPSLLQDLATREVTRYLAGVDLNDLISSGRLAAESALVQRTQAASDEHELGARIVSVGLQDCHPPVRVATNYEAVVSSTQLKRAKILAARADDIKTNALAGAEAVKIVSDATAFRVEREIGALARAGLFTNQLTAFAAAPSVYAQRAYLQAFVRATADARKYLLLTTNTHDVLTFDLEQKYAESMLQMKVPEPKK